MLKKSIKMGMNKTDRTAFVFAAGLGTRLKPLTDNMPKALVPYHGRPLLESLLLKLKSSGYSRVVINVHHFADMIEDFVRENGGFGLDIVFSDERELLRDTGGGLYHARTLIETNNPDSKFLIHNVDIVSTLDLDWFYSQHRDGDLATLLVSHRQTQRYLLFDDQMRLVGWTNIVTGEVRSPYEDVRLSPGSYRRLAFGGIHMMSSDIFEPMNEWETKFSIVDFYLSVLDKYTIRGCLSPSGVSLIDVGKLSQIEK